MSNTDLIRQLAEGPLNKQLITLTRTVGGNPDTAVYYIRGEFPEHSQDKAYINWRLVGVIFDTVNGWGKEKRDAFDDALYQLFLTPEGLIEPRRLTPRMCAETLLEISDHTNT